MKTEIKQENCECCSKRFARFFACRHTCKVCMKCVCRFCSHQSVILLEYDPRKLIKVCCVCALEVKNNRVYGF